MGRNRGGNGGKPASSSGMFGRGAAPAPAARPAAPAPPPPAQAARAPPPPAQQQHAPPPMMAPQGGAPAMGGGGGGMLSGLGGMVMQGVVMGGSMQVGREIANSAMGMMSGGGDKSAPAPPPQQQQAAPAYPQAGASTPTISSNDVCGANQKELYQCLQENNNNAASCNFYYDAWRNCQENAGQRQFA